MKQRGVKIAADDGVTPDWASLVAGQQLDTTPASNVDELIQARKNYDFRHLNVNLPDLAATHFDVELGRVGDRIVRAEIYVPVGDGPFPAALFLHGGAWYVGDAENERKLAMELAHPGLVVVNLSYALAPEQPFPAALEDCVYAARWITKNIDQYSGDPSRIAVMGASAGANLSAATIAALHSTEHQRLDGGDLANLEVQFAAAALFYGVFDIPATVADAQGIRRHKAKHTSYLGPNWQDRMDDPLVSPVRSAALGTFPPCYFSCGDRDALLPQTLDMIRALSAEGVPVGASIVEGADHVFLNMSAEMTSAAEELTRISAWLAEHLATTAS